VTRLPLAVTAFLIALLVLWNLRAFESHAASGVREGAVLDRRAPELSVAQAEASTVEVSELVAAPEATGTQRRALGAKEEARAARSAPEGAVSALPPLSHPPRWLPSQPRIEYFADGRERLVAERRDGVLHGTWTEWWPSGEKAVEGGHVEGARSGPWVFFYESGAKMEEGLFVGGNREGQWASWHEEGTPVREVRYRDGHLEGLYTEWYSNGQVRCRGGFVEGRREGTWQFFDYEGGSDRRSGYYRAGRRVR